MVALAFWRVPREPNRVFALKMGIAVFENESNACELCHDPFCGEPVFTADVIRDGRVEVVEVCTGCALGLGMSESVEAYGPDPRPQWNYESDRLGYYCEM